MGNANTSEEIKDLFSNFDVDCSGALDLKEILGLTDSLCFPPPFFDFVQYLKEKEERERGEKRRGERNRIFSETLFFPVASKRSQERIYLFLVLHFYFFVLMKTKMVLLIALNLLNFLRYLIF